MKLRAAAGVLGLALCASSRAATIARGFPVVLGRRDRLMSAGDLAVDADGNAYLLGETREGGSTTISLWKLDGAGAAAPGYPLQLLSGGVSAASVALGPDGSVYVVGNVLEEGFDAQLVVWKLDASGRVAAGFPVAPGLGFGWLGSRVTLRRMLSALTAGRASAALGRATAAAVDEDGNLWVTGYRRVRRWTAGEVVLSARALCLWKLHPDGRLFDGFPKSVRGGQGVGESMGTQLLVQKGGIEVFGPLYLDKQVYFGRWDFDSNGAARDAATLFRRPATESETDARTRDLALEFDARARRAAARDAAGSLWWVGESDGKCFIGRAGAGGKAAGGLRRAGKPCGLEMAASAGRIWVAGLPEDRSGGLGIWRAGPDGRPEPASYVSWKPAGHDSAYPVGGAAAGKDGSVWFAGELPWGSNADLFVLKVAPGPPAARSPDP